MGPVIQTWRRLRLSNSMLVRLLVLPVLLSKEGVIVRMMCRCRVMCKTACEHVVTVWKRLLLNVMKPGTDTRRGCTRWSRSRGVSRDS